MPQSIYTRPRIMHSCGLIPEIQAGLETIWTLTSYADGSRRKLPGTAVFKLAILPDYGDCTYHQHRAIMMNQAPAPSSRTRSDLAILCENFNVNGAMNQRLRRKMKKRVSG